MKRPRSIRRDIGPEKAAQLAEAFGAYQRQHEGQGPLDVPLMASTTLQSTAIVDLAWLLIERGADDEEVIDALRDKASGDLRVLGTAETQLRMTGFVAEQSHYYRCWSLLRAASGDLPEELPPESLRQTAEVEKFLELSSRSQLQQLKSKVPTLEDLLRRVRGDPNALGAAYSELRGLIGPESAHHDLVLRSRTAMSVIESDLARAAFARR